LQQAPDGQWRLSLSDGSSMVSGCVILASAFAGALSPVPLAIDRARGQLSMVPQRPGQTLDKVVCRDGYLTPAVRGWHTIGATIQKNDACADARQADDLENFQRVQRLLPGFVEDPALLSSGRVAWRAVTQDRLPMVGRVADGVYASLAHGSRGITCAPLCGEWLAALILGECLPLAASWQRLLDPLRMASSEASSGAS
jgi:tRNA 5-methylaminomethyl-2-thiouridine biosynthesis bifunctional protein